METDASNPNNRNQFWLVLKPLYESERFPIIFASVYSICLLCVGLIFHKVGNFGVETDFYWGYAPQARMFLLGKFTIDPFHGPMYPWILGLISEIFGDLFRSGIIISVVSASLCLFFIFEIIKSVFSSDIAFLSTVLVAINKTFIEYSYTASTDMLFASLCLAALFFLFRQSVITLLQLCLSAAFAGLAYLVRYNGFIFLFIFPIIILLRAVKIKGLPNWSAALVWLMLFLAIIAPWSVYLKLNRGNFFYNKDYQNIAYEVFAKGEVSWDVFWSKYANRFTSYYDVVINAPVLFIVTLCINAVMHLVNDVAKLNYFLIGIPSVIGGVFFAFSHPERKKIALILVFVSFFAVLLPIFYSARFSLFLIPMYAIFFSIFVRTLIYRFKGRRAVTALFNSFLVVVILMSYAESYSFNSVNISSGPNEMLLIRNWFRKEYGDRYDDAKILARKPQIAFLLDMQLYPFPLVDNYDSLIAVMKRNGVKFLYYGTIEAQLRPQFLDLFKLDSAHAGLEPLCITNKPPSVLYEVIRSK